MSTDWLSFCSSYLVEDILKDKIEPYSSHLIPFKSYEIQEVKSISRHDSPVSIPADDIAIPIATPPSLIPFPRLPSPPPLTLSPSIDKSRTMSAVTEKNISYLPEQIQVVELEKVRQGKSRLIFFPWERSMLKNIFFLCFYLNKDLLDAIEDRTLSRLESAIQQVKENDYIEELKYDYERALELLNRLMKIEHMK